MNLSKDDVNLSLRCKVGYNFGSIGTHSRERRYG